jgi:peptide/nickel transport system permease protein
MGPLAGFLLRRLLGMIAVLAVLVTGTFFMIRLLHADPAVQVAGLDADPATVARIRAELGLDRPLAVQFADYVVGLAHLDLGSSYEAPITYQAGALGLPVSRVIGERLPWTAGLAGVAIVIVAVFSIPLGMIAGLLTTANQRRRFAAGFTGVSSLIGAIPAFLQATFLSAVFAVWLAWLPVGTGPDIPVWQAIILPAVSIAIGDTFVLARVVRIETLNVLAQDYIRTARSKRLSTATIYLRHVLPNVLTGSLTIGGAIFASLLAGTVIVENVFDWPGIGTRLVNSILVGDYPVIQAAVLLLGTAVVVINTAVDVTLGLLDPRTLNR